MKKGASLYRANRAGTRYAAGGTVVIEGLVPLQRALRRAEGDTDQHLKKRLKEAAEPVKRAAQAGVTNKWPDRPGDLAASIKIGVNQRSVSVYSNAPHAKVQDQGGVVAGRGPHIFRASASKYMTKAITKSAAEVNQRLGKVLDDLGRNFDK